MINRQFGTDGCTYISLFNNIEGQQPVEVKMPAVASTWPMLCHGVSAGKKVHFTGSFMSMHFATTASYKPR